MKRLGIDKHTANLLLTNIKSFLKNINTNINANDNRYRLCVQFK